MIAVVLTTAGVIVGWAVESMRQRAALHRQVVEAFTRPPMSTQIPTMIELPPSWTESA